MLENNNSMYKIYKGNVYALHRGIWHLILEGWFDRIEYHGDYAVVIADQSMVVHPDNIAILYMNNHFRLFKWPTLANMDTFRVIDDSDLYDGVHLIAHPRPHMMEEFYKDVEFLNRSTVRVKPDFEEVE